MTYILSADWHCHSWSQFASTNEEGINERLQHILDEIEEMAIVAKDRGAERVFAAGDIFHVRGSIKPTVFNPVADCLARCASQYGVEFVLMPGNHDLESAETEVLSSAITSLDAIPGVQVINEPTVFLREKVVMIPWHNTRDGLRQAIEDMAEQVVRPSDFDLLLHTGINGVIIGMPDHGWAASELAAFGFGRVFCGHYHEHGVFAIDHEGYTVTVTSIGALTHQTWSDVGTRAGFLIVENDGFDQVSSQAPKFVDLKDDFEASDARGNYVRVRGVELDQDEIKGLRDSLLEEGAKGVIIDPMVKREATRSGSVSGAEGVRVERQISDYAKEHYGGLAEQIEREALDVLDEVRSST